MAQHSLGAHSPVRLSPATAQSRLQMCERFGVVSSCGPGPISMALQQELGVIVMCPSVSRGSWHHECSSSAPAQPSLPSWDSSPSNTQPTSLFPACLQPTSLALSCPLASCFQRTQSCLRGWQLPQSLGTMDHSTLETQSSKLMEELSQCQGSQSLQPLAALPSASELARWVRATKSKALPAQL